MLAEIPFTSEMQETPRPTPEAVTEYAQELRIAVQDRIKEIWNMDLSEGLSIYVMCRQRSAANA